MVAKVLPIKMTLKSCLWQFCFVCGALCGCEAESKKRCLWQNWPKRAGSRAEKMGIYLPTPFPPQGPCPPTSETSVPHHSIPFDFAPNTIIPCSIWSPAWLFLHYSDLVDPCVLHIPLVCVTSLPSLSHTSLLIVPKWKLLVVFLDAPDKCVGNPCKNGGTCIPDIPGNSFTCNCRPGYTGNKCQNRE